MVPRVLFALLFSSEGYFINSYMWQTLLEVASMLFLGLVVCPSFPSVFLPAMPYPAVLNTHSSTEKSVKSFVVAVMFGSSKIGLQHMWSYTGRVVIQESSTCTIDLRGLRHLCVMKRARKRFADPGAECA